ncbi:MAG: hypothetical protein WA821_11595 [Anaerolineales bacterium]
MRTLLRTTLITMTVVFSALILFWSLARNSNAAQSAQAAPATPTIPEHCVKDLQEWLAKPRSPKERQTAVQAELDCAAGAQTYPSRKKTALAKFTPPTSRPASVPYSTPTLQVGIQMAELGAVPQSSFMPEEDGNNLWADFVNGQVAQVIVGYINDPDWQDHPRWAIQGALQVVQNYEWTKSKLYPTLTRHGEVHFIAACGTKLFLQATDGAIFAFDVATLSYVSNTVMACPTVTLRAGIMSSSPPIDPGNFVLTVDYHNGTWQDTIDGKLVQVYAGSLEESNPNNSGRRLQGLVLVSIAGAQGEEYPTPGRHGEVRFIAACGTKLFLQATDGTVFVFDAATLAYVDNAPACPTVTP